MTPVALAAAPGVRATTAKLSRPGDAQVRPKAEQAADHDRLRATRAASRTKPTVPPASSPAAGVSPSLARRSASQPDGHPHDDAHRAAGGQEDPGAALLDPGRPPRR
ncbi:MAG: hypothetical protein WKF31_01325 [Thermoleophilaceae bacterium]